MKCNLGAQGEKPVEKMRIGVSTEQQYLEDQHASCPDARAASVPRQNVFAHDGLDLKEQERTHKNGQCKEKNRDTMGQRFVHERYVGHVSRKPSIEFCLEPLLEIHIRLYPDAAESRSHERNRRGATSDNVALRSAKEA